MAFSIKFANDGELVDNYDQRTLEGSIVVDTFEERFFAPVSYWNADDYRLHWKKSLQRILTGADVSCLITSMYDPNTANFIVWWPIYLMCDVVIFQNQLLFLEPLQGSFDANDPFRFVRPRQVTSQLGKKISEWTTSLECVRHFYENM